MARKKARRATKAKPLLKRFSASPVNTTKAEWRKLPPVGKALVALAAVGFTGIGAAEIANMGKLGSAV